MSPAATPVVVCEFFTAGGRLEVGGSDAADGDRVDRRRSALLAEGRAMLTALLEDLAALPDVAPVAVVDPTLVETRRLPGDVEPASGEPALAAVRAAEGRAGAWIWPVAPETRGALARMCQFAGESDAGVVGTPELTVRATARRSAMLRRVGRPPCTVPGWTQAETPEEARAAVRALGWPVVVKPGRGAGGAGTTRVEEPEGIGPAWRRAFRADGRYPPLVQEYVEGDPASAVVLGTGTSTDGSRTLALSSQHIFFDPAARYIGGRTPLPGSTRDAAVKAKVMASIAVDCMDRLRGLVGVDLVLTPAGPVVIEINPRLTTSYLGLRRHVGPAAAAAGLRASGCEVEGPRLGPDPELPLGYNGAEPVTFGATGGG